MVRVHIFIVMDKNIKENGKMINKMGKEFNFMLIMIDMKGILRMERDVGEEYIIIIVGINLMENIEMIQEMVLDHYF